MHLQYRAVLSLDFFLEPLSPCLPDIELLGWTGGTDAKTREMKFLRDDARAW